MRNQRLYCPGEGGNAVNHSTVVTPKRQSNSGAQFCDSPADRNYPDGSSKFSNKSPNEINFNGSP